jgi:hypothetical protein
MSGPASIPGSEFPNKFAAELVATARAICAPGKGILAADESTGTIGKRVSVMLAKEAKIALGFGGSAPHYIIPPMPTDPTVWGGGESSHQRPRSASLLSLSTSALLLMLPQAPA